MHLGPSIFERQQCPGSELFYRCGGFNGCCSVNPCASGCPDIAAAPAPASPSPAPGTTAGAPPPATTSAGFSTIVPPSGTGAGAPVSASSAGSSSPSPPATELPAEGAPSLAEGEGISRAAIGGIVAGIIVFLQVVLVLLFLYYRRKKLQRPKISPPVLIKTGKSVESFSSDGSPTRDPNRDMKMKRGGSNRVAARFDGQEDKWSPFDPSKRQSSFYSTNSADVSPISAYDTDAATAVSPLPRALAVSDREKAERAPSPLASNPVRVVEMDGTAASRPVELESPIEPVFTKENLPPRDPSSLASSQRSNSKRASQQRAQRSLSPISEGLDSPRATLGATSKERQLNKYVTDWSQFEPTSPLPANTPGVAR